MERDVFICHASEDKADVVKPLVSALEAAGIRCWVDEGEIKWGDSITQKVNEGLGMSRFVIVVLSQSFQGKNWPERELHAVVNIEASTGEVKALPLLVGDRGGRAAILSRYPLLNDKRYLIWDDNPGQIVEEIRKILPGSPRTYPTADETALNKTGAPDDIPFPRIRKSFSDRDKDLFLKEAFATIKDYFQRGLAGLERQYPEIETDFTEVNALNYISKIYYNGDVKCQCKIWIGGLSASDGIAYSEGRLNIEQNNSYNELLTVADAGRRLSLRSLFGHLSQGQAKEDYSPSEAANLLWLRFVAPLERP